MKIQINYRRKDFDNGLEEFAFRVWIESEDLVRGLTNNEKEEMLKDLLKAMPIDLVDIILQEKLKRPD